MSPRKEIEAVRSEALGLHKKLIDAARWGYEARHGQIAAGEMLRLVAFDPDFAWLRPLSRLILGIDDRLDRGEISRSDLDAVLAEADEVYGRQRDRIARA